MYADVLIKVAKIPGFAQGSAPAWLSKSLISASSPFLVSHHAAFCAADGFWPLVGTTPSLWSDLCNQHHRGPIQVSARNNSIN